MMIARSTYQDYYKSEMYVCQQLVLANNKSFQIDFFFVRFLILDFSGAALHDYHSMTL